MASNAVSQAVHYSFLLTSLTIILLLAARVAADVDIQTVDVAAARGAANAAPPLTGAAGRGGAEIQTVDVVAKRGAANAASPISFAAGRGGAGGAEIQTVPVAGARGAVEAASASKAVAGTLTAAANDNCPPGVGQFLSLNGRQYQKEAKIVIKTRRRKGEGN
jgi:hypothetical protein